MGMHIISGHHNGWGRRYDNILCLGIFLSIGLICRIHEFSVSALSTMPERRALPDKILVGYATNCNSKVVKAVRDGVNVVIWSFVEMTVDENSQELKCKSTFDVDCAKATIAQLDSEGYSDTVHMVSFGGWNGPHLPDGFRAEELYKAWKDLVGDIFHGVDWDLEGHDNLESPTNVFSIECLENMGCFSELAKNDGYLVGMAPPQSYLDIATSRFSRAVNLADPGRGWHEEFHYFGRNVYSYLLSKYGNYIDFVSVQFYESYARAGLEVFHEKMAPERYLEKYVGELLASCKHDPEEASFFVDFDQDPTLNHPSRRVAFPLSKLVFGFANGWGANDDDKVCYFDPKEISIAYKKLLETNRAPRGFMFWVIDEEGTKDINFSSSLNDILEIHKATKDISCDIVEAS